MAEEKVVKEKNPFYKKWWVWVLAIIIIANIANIGGEEEAAKEPAEPTEVAAEDTEKEVVEEEPAEKEVAAEESAAEVPKEPADLESQARSIVHEEIGEKNNMDKERIADLTVTELVEGSNVVIDLNASENLTNGMTRTGILMNSVEILEPLSKVGGIANIKLVWLLPLVDQYGNEEDGRVLSFVIDKETRDKINWENFDQENLATVTADYFEHPAFKE